MSDTPLTDKTFSEHEGSVAAELSRAMNFARDLEIHLRELVSAVDGAFISSWQSTAGWQKQLDAAKQFLGDNT